ncbi:hypothetical protein [Companilactobacillus zhongbaensis]|uniref:hypothetical protein n=1 Tax=Companilactobacillus zhongbaensis TaxID=2486009 RepID=UPI0013DE2520|nr:hypothetical protein [Companilactobacillus zhongbaensis]
MELFNNIVLIVLTVAVTCGVILISVPLFRIQGYLRKSKRPFFVINKKRDGSFYLQNTGNSECAITSVFLNDEDRYYEDLNGVSFAPHQKISFEIPVTEENNNVITIQYFDSLSKKYFRQKFVTANL